MSKAISFILGGQSITVFLDGKTYAINKESATYDLVVNAVRTGNEALVRQTVNVRNHIATSLQAKSDKIRVTDNSIWYGDYEITGLVASRVFEVIRLGLDVQPMIKFLENLMDNPSSRAVEELFGFLDACSLPLTSDGHFLAYKRVRSNYRDVHSGKFDNSVGAICEMPRFQVDDNKHQTCSSGLHFCSYDYLQSFSGERIMILKINPRDVVSIPVDYNNSKGRCCRYEVVDELDVTDYLPTKPISDNYTTQYGGYGSFDVQDDADDADEINTEAVNDAVTKPKSNGGYGLKFNAQDVKAILHALNVRGDTLADVAKAFHTSTRTIGRIRDGKR